MAIAEQVRQLPDQPGVYFFKDARGAILYVGKASSLRKRVGSYLRKETPLISPRTRLMLAQAAKVDYVSTSSEAEALIYENSLIKEHQPKYNVALRDDKTYPFLKITHEPFPRLLVTRKRLNDGARYYGPYTDVTLMRQAVRMMRKLFPLRTCRQFPKHPCLEYHLGQCLAPCVGYIDESAYQELVQEQVMFLEGRRDALLKRLSANMDAAAKALQFEEAARIRDQIRALTSVVVPRQRVTPTDAVDALRALLRLPSAPQRIEAYDISNIHGHEAVGSLVVFHQGKPHRDGYRRFKIKTVQGIDDYQMMQEVIRRRFTGELSERDPKPDLLLIDGGRGHVNAVRETLRSIGQWQLPVIGIAKEFERIIVPEDPNPVILPPSSPILQLIQRLRDEAHRFAITYHRQLHRELMRHSALDPIPGIGRRRKADLLAAFESVDAIRQASVDDLMQVRGITRKQAELVKEHLR